MAFADLFQDLMGVCKADPTELMNHNGTQEETLLGDITEQCFTHLKYGEALENIKSAARTLLHTQDQLLEVQGKMEPLSLNMNHLAKQINQMKKETGDLCCRETELQEENITKEQKLSEMESKVKSKDQQLEDQKNELTQFSKKIEDECGLRIDISSAGTYIISLAGLMKTDDDFCTCELTVDTTNIVKGEYKVLRTSPDLGGDVLHELAQCLNETSDLAGFIATLRKNFKKYM